MVKDLGLSQQAAEAVNADTPMGAHALALTSNLLVWKMERGAISPLCCLDFRPENVLLNPRSEPI